MRKLLWATLFVVILLTALPISAQSPNYDVLGPVWRVQPIGNLVERHD